MCGYWARRVCAVICLGRSLFPVPAFIVDVTEDRRPQPAVGQFLSSSFFFFGFFIGVITCFLDYNIYHACIRPAWRR